MKKTIIFVTTSTSGGGAEKVLVNIINSLAVLSKYKIILIITSSAPIPKNLESGIIIKRLHKSKAHNAFKYLYREIISIKPDYIFTTSSNIFYMLFTIKKVCRLNSKIYVRVTVTPSEQIICSWKNKLIYAINQITYRHADLIIAQTKYMKNDLCNKYHINPNKIKVIRNIIDYKNLDKAIANNITCYKNSDYNIVASGALYSVKGFDILINAFALASREIHNAQLYILGKERYELGYQKYLENLIELLGLTNKVHLLGYKENPYPYYKDADLFVLSSRTEGYPNVVLEALYYGTPVIATDCVDFSGVIVEGINGYVIKRESIKDMYKAIMLAHDNLRKPITYIPIENFDYSKIFV